MRSWIAGRAESKIFKWNLFGFILFLDLTFIHDLKFPVLLFFDPSDILSLSLFFF